jgi:hypothetical protein
MLRLGRRTIGLPVILVALAGTISFFFVTISYGLFFQYSLNPLDLILPYRPPAPAPSHALSSPLIPKKLWYKTGPKGLSDITAKCLRSCIQSNPGYEVQILTEDAADLFVNQTFSKSHPDLVEMYLGLPGMLLARTGKRKE